MTSYRAVASRMKVLYAGCADYAATDVEAIEWHIDADGDGGYESGEPSFVVSHKDGDGTLDYTVCCDEDGDAVVSNGDVLQGDRSTEFTFPVSVLNRTDPPIPDPYHYRVEGTAGTMTDQVPQGGAPTIEHDITVAVPSPAPTSAPDDTSTPKPKAAAAPVATTQPASRPTLPRTGRPTKDYVRWALVLLTGGEVLLLVELEAERRRRPARD